MVLEKLEGHVGFQEFNPKKKKKKELKFEQREFQENRESFYLLQRK